MQPNLNTAVKELRNALSLSQQAFATQLGLSIRAVVNYEKNRAPTARALAQLEQLASDNPASKTKAQKREHAAKHTDVT